MAICVSTAAFATPIFNPGGGTPPVSDPTTNPQTTVYTCAGGAMIYGHGADDACACAEACEKEGFGPTCKAHEIRQDPPPPPPPK